MEVPALSMDVLALSLDVQALSLDVRALRWKCGRFAVGAGASLDVRVASLDGRALSMEVLVHGPATCWRPRGCRNRKVERQSTPSGSPAAARNARTRAR